MSGNLDLSPDPAISPSIRGEKRKGYRHTEAVVALRRLIEIGDLLPGTRLREIATSQKLGMSRTPVREAFRTLAAEGFVDLLPNRSVVVRNIATNGNKTLADVCDVLSALEGLAARQACKRMSQEAIDRLGELQDKLEQSFGCFDRENFIAIKYRIHELIVEASLNAPLATAWRAIVPRAELFLNRRAIDRDHWSKEVYVHRLLITALSQRDGVRAHKLFNDGFGSGLVNSQTQESDV